MLDSLDHVVIAVSDLERAAGRTAALLGRRPSWRGEHPVAGTANVLFRLDNTYVELLCPAGTGPVGSELRRHLDRSGEGLVALAFGTADAEACHAAWQAGGLEPAAPQPGLGRDVESGAFREWRSVMLPLGATRGVRIFAIEHRSPPDVLPRAAPFGPPEATVRAVDHVVVQTEDVEASLALYRDRLGLRLALDRRFEQWGMRLLFFRVGGLTVEVAARLDETGDASSPDRLWGLSYRVDDAEGARARLHAAGFDVSEVRAGRKPGTRVLTVRGEPSGVATLMLEPARPAEAGG